MKITVHVTKDELHGVPFEQYSTIASSLICETYLCENDVVLADKLAVFIEDATEDVDANDILNLAQEFAHPDHRDADFFGWTPEDWSPSHPEPQS